MICSLRGIKYAQDISFLKDDAFSLGYNTEMSAMQGTLLKVKNRS